MLLRFSTSLRNKATTAALACALTAAGAQRGGEPNIEPGRFEPSNSGSRQRKYRFRYSKRCHATFLCTVGVNPELARRARRRAPATRIQSSLDHIVENEWCLVAPVCRGLLSFTAATHAHVSTMYARCHFPWRPDNSSMPAWLGKFTAIASLDRSSLECVLRRNLCYVALHVVARLESGIRTRCRLRVRRSRGNRTRGYRSRAGETSRQTYL